MACSRSESICEKQLYKGRRDAAKPEEKVWKNEVEYGEEEEQHWPPPCGAEGPSGDSLGRADHVLDGWEEEVHLWAFT